MSQNSMSRDTVIISGDTSIVIGESTTLTASEGFESYTWSTEETTREIIVAPEITTKYWVDAVADDNTTSSDTITVVVNNYIINHSQLDLIHEPGQPDSLWVELSEEATPLWSNDSTDNYIIVDPDENTTYTLSVIVEEEEVQTLVYNVKLANIIDFISDTVCMGDSTTFQNISISGDTISKIIWDLDGDTQFDDGEGEIVKYKYEIGGNHPVGMRVYYTNGTFDAIYNIIPVGEKPIVDFDWDNVCYDKTTKFIDKSTINSDTLVSWLWDFGDGNTSENQDYFNLYAQPDIYFVSLKVGSDVGCFDSLTKQLEIIEIPQLQLISSNDSVVEDGDVVYFTEEETVTITITNSTEYDSTIWYNNEKGSEIVISEQTSVYVTGYSEGCATTKSFTTSWGNVPPQPTGDEIMNLFTPNGDGINDTWIVNDKQITTPIKVNVYNRSGKQVYANNNYNHTWDGQYNGNPLPQGTYYYIIEDAAGLFFKGAITIIR